jgi:small-conductance mechanosensitive channel
VYKVSNLLNDQTSSITLFLEHMIKPIILIVIGLLVGLILDQFVLHRLRRRVEMSGWKVNRVVVDSLQGMPLWWSILIGFYGGIVYSPFSSEQVAFWLRLLLVPFILSITIFVMRLGIGFIDYSNESSGGSVATLSLSRSLIKVIVFLTGVLVLLQSLGISITPIIAALGISGIAISLAMEETLSNVFSGLYIIFSKQVQPGDYVRMKIDESDNINGYITDITWRCTKIRIIPDRIVQDDHLGIVTVPNSRMAADIVVMHYRTSREQEIMIDLRVAAGADLGVLEAMTIEAATQGMTDVLGNVPNCTPVVRYRCLSSQTVDLTLALYGNETMDMNLIRHQVVKRLYTRYQQEGIILTERVD